MNQRRPSLLDIAHSSRAGTDTVVILLGWQEREYRGEATGAVDPEHPVRLYGEATLRAVEQVSGGRLAAELLAVATTDLGPVRIALAQVRVADSPEPLVGSSVVMEDPPRAAVKAVLDAVNRRLEAVL
jgi:hypothetical protein